MKTGCPHWLQGGRFSVLFIASRTRVWSFDMNTREKREALSGFLFIAPWLIGFLVFQFYPLVSASWFSLTRYNIISPARFVGLRNFVTAFTKDVNFRQSLSVTFLYVFTAVPLKLAFALLVAMILNINIRFITVFRTIYYIPSIMGASVAISVVWRFLFMKDGLINNFLARSGIPGVDWIGSPRMAITTIIALTVWQFGSSMVIFLAGLKQIPQEMYEAAQIDGARKFRMFLVITLPMLSPIIFFNLVMQVINGFQDFTAPMVITAGGPAKATYLYGLLLYDNAFRLFKMGYASALSWILFVIIIIITLVLFRTSGRWTFYQYDSK